MHNPQINETKTKRAIGQRLSLRKPQELSLDILSDVLGMMEFGKPTDIKALLSNISAKYPSVQSFEREFPSLCFALATGVGKTRLMGAMIAYLFQTRRSRNFFRFFRPGDLASHRRDHGSDAAAGATPKLTFNPLESIQTMTAYIVQVSLGDTPAGGLAYQTLFAVAVVLFFTTLVLNLVADFVMRKFKEDYE